MDKLDIPVLGELTVENAINFVSLLISSYSSFAKVLLTKLFSCKKHKLKVGIERLRGADTGSAEKEMVY